MKDHAEFIFKLSELQADFIHNAMVLADKYGANRNIVAKCVLNSFKRTLENANFERYNVNSKRGQENGTDGED